MPPETPTATDSAPDAVAAAPRREKRLVPVAPRPKPARPASAVRVARDPAARPAQASALEGKVAALQDPHEILNLIRTEAALRRAQRLSGAGDAQRQTMRLLSVFMLFALLIAAVGAMWWLQTSLQGSRRAHRAAPSPAVQPR